MTIANELYKSVDVESSEGVRQQVTNWCANREELVESFVSEGRCSNVIFIDGSSASFSDDSITAA